LITQNNYQLFFKAENLQVLSSRKVSNNNAIFSKRLISELMDLATKVDVNTQVSEIQETNNSIQSKVKELQSANTELVQSIENSTKNQENINVFLQALQPFNPNITLIKVGEVVSPNVVNAITTTLKDSILPLINVIDSLNDGASLDSKIDEMLNTFDSLPLKLVNISKNIKTVNDITSSAVELKRKIDGLSTIGFTYDANDSIEQILFKLHEFINNNLLSRNILKRKNREMNTKITNLQNSIGSIVNEKITDYNSFFENLKSTVLEILKVNDINLTTDFDTIITKLSSLKPGFYIENTSLIDQFNQDINIINKNIDEINNLIFVCNKANGDFSTINDDIAQQTAKNNLYVNANNIIKDTSTQYTSGVTSPIGDGKTLYTTKSYKDSLTNNINTNYSTRSSLSNEWSNLRYISSQLNNALSSTFPSYYYFSGIAVFYSDLRKILYTMAQVQYTYGPFTLGCNAASYYGQFFPSTSTWYDYNLAANSNMIIGPFDSNMQSTLFNTFDQYMTDLTNSKTNAVNVESLFTQVATIQTNIDTKTMSNTTLNEKINDFKDILNEIKRKIVQVSISLQNIQNYNTQITKDIDTMNSLTTSVNNSNNSLNSDISTQTTNVIELQNQLNISIATYIQTQSVFNEFFNQRDSLVLQIKEKLNNMNKIYSNIFAIKSQMIDKLNKIKTEKPKLYEANKANIDKFSETIEKISSLNDNSVFLANNNLSLHLEKLKLQVSLEENNNIKELQTIDSNRFLSIYSNLVNNINSYFDTSFDTNFGSFDGVLSFVTTKKPSFVLSESEDLNFGQMFFDALTNLGVNLNYNIDFNQMDQLFQTLSDLWVYKSKDLTNNAIYQEGSLCYSTNYNFATLCYEIMSFVFLCDSIGIVDKCKIDYSFFDNTNVNSLQVLMKDISNLIYGKSFTKGTSNSNLTTISTTSNNNLFNGTHGKTETAIGNCNQLFLAFADFIKYFNSFYLILRDMERYRYSNSLSSIYRGSTESCYPQLQLQYLFTNSNSYFALIRAANGNGYFSIPAMIAALSNSNFPNN
jgi:hypothetical protein